MCQLLYTYACPESAFPWDRCCGLLPSDGDECPLQPSPQAVSSPAVGLVRSFICLPVVLNVSDLSHMFSVERSNAIFVAEIFTQCVAIISVKL